MAPVRKIPIGTRALTGRHARSGGKYESGLERDFFELMTQNPLFNNLDWQPLKLTYIGSDGKSKYYTPDALVTFKVDPTTGFARRPLLAEVKYRSEYRAHFCELRDRFRVARQYAKTMGWQFKVVTDREIRTTAFANRHFLNGFINRPPNTVAVAELIHWLEHLGVIQIQSLLTAISPDSVKQAAILPTLWWMLAHEHIEFNLSMPLNMHSVVHLHRG